MAPAIAERASVPVIASVRTPASCVRASLPGSEALQEAHQRQARVLHGETGCWNPCHGCCTFPAGRVRAPRRVDERLHENVEKVLTSSRRCCRRRVMLVALLELSEFERCRVTSCLCEKLRGLH
jgi:hypothetical protein